MIGMNRHENIHKPVEWVVTTRNTSWDIGAVSSALDREPSLTRDPAHGPGVRYALGEHDALTVELFPPTAERHSGIVRLSTEDALLEFYRQPAPAIRPEGVIFETRDLLISLAPSGELMAYRVVPGQDRETPQDAPESITGPETPLATETPARTDPDGPGGIVQGSLPQPRQDKQPRVSFSGRLGTDPRCRTTPRQVLVCSFPVAEKREGFDTPKWRNTVTFKALAKKIQETMKKGDLVDIIGYEHEKARKGKDGKTRHETEVYAVVVKQR